MPNLYTRHRHDTKLLFARSFENGAFSPLSSGDVPGVLALLNGALSMAPAQQKQAESTLAALEQRQGFCSCLVVRTRPVMARNGSTLRLYYDDPPPA